MPKRSEDSDGVRCPHCGCRHNKVRHTIPRTVTWNGVTRTTIRRVRICMHCNVPYTTVEHLEDENNIGLPDIPIPPKEEPPKGKPRRNPYL